MEIYSARGRAWVFHMQYGDYDGLAVDNVNHAFGREGVIT